jgi:hypothetical protein
VTAARSGRSPGTRARLLLAGLGLVVLAGCGGARNTLGTSASACFRDLPEAKQAVGKGQLVGVRRVSAARMRRRLPNNPQLDQTAVKDLCVLAFRDSYRPGDVPDAMNATTGHYALVAIELGRPRVVTVVVLDTLPTRFSHLR